MVCFRRQPKSYGSVDGTTALVVFTVSALVSCRPTQNINDRNEVTTQYRAVLQKMIHSWSGNEKLWNAMVHRDAHKSSPMDCIPN